jgi:hypothetical protein
MDEPEIEDGIDEVSEYVWKVWTSRETFDMQVNLALGADGKPYLFWYWTDDQPLNGFLIAKEKMEDIFKFMAKRPFPKELLDNLPDKLLHNKIESYKNWLSFNSWKAPSRLPPAGEEELREWQKGQPNANEEDVKQWRNNRLIANGKRFRLWQKLLTIEHFKAERKKILLSRTNKDREGLPSFTYNPEEKRTTWPHKISQEKASLEREAVLDAVRARP